MAQIPELLRDDKTSYYLKDCGFKRIHQGKVRDSYLIPAQPELLMPIATDRISIFDFVLPALVPLKGEILTAMTYFWLTQVIGTFDNHLKESEKYYELNAIHDLREKFPLIPTERALVVRKMNIQQYELIYRYHLGGSVYAKYLETGKVAGIDVTPGLPKWTKMDEPLFTPSTKAEEGHDINITVAEYLEAMGKDGVMSKKFFSMVYKAAYEYARSKGILILDTKFEGPPSMIADEVLTPDSSRFTIASEYEKAIEKGVDPPFYDKEPVREWGRGIETPFGVKGINKLDPKNPDHVEFVHSLTVPDEVISATSTRYQWIFHKLTGMSIMLFQQNVMKVR